MENHNIPTADPGGSGGQSAIEHDMEVAAIANEYDRREGNGRSKIQNSRMLNRAIRGGWLGQRFPTGATPSDLRKLMQVRELDLAEKAVVAVHADLGSTEPRVRGIAAKNAIAMERVNQQDEAETKPLLQQNNFIVASPEKRQEWIEAIMRRVGSNGDTIDEQAED